MQELGVEYFYEVQGNVKLFTLGISHGICSHFSKIRPFKIRAGYIFFKIFEYEISYRIDHYRINHAIYKIELYLP